MLTSTLLFAKDFISEPLSKDSARILIRDLEEFSLLITSSEDIRQLETIMPSQEFACLKERIKSGRIRCRVRTETGREIELFSEVRVTPNGKDHDPALWGTSVDNYADSPPVLHRREIRSGSVVLDSRDEFWLQVVVPMLRAMTRSRSRIEVVDSYLLDDYLRYTKSRSEMESGLGWFLRSLSSFAETSSSDLTVVIFAAASDDRPNLTLRAIQDAMMHLTRSLCPNLKIRLGLIPPRNFRGVVRDAMHHRRIVTTASNGSLIYLGLDRGISDFNLPNDGSTIRACSTFNYVPYVHPGSDRHDSSLLLASIPSDHLIDL